MHIKPHSTNNEYIRAGDLWVRNFDKNVKPLSLNYMFTKEDYQEVFSNTSRNVKYPQVSDELLIFDKIVIVSDGFNFSKIHHDMQDFPKDVAILTTNGALRFWELMSPKIDAENRRSINGYIANNRSQEC